MWKITRCWPVGIFLIRPSRKYFTFGFFSFQTSEIVLFNRAQMVYEESPIGAVHIPLSTFSHKKCYFLHKIFEKKTTASCIQPTQHTSPPHNYPYPLSQLFHASWRQYTRSYNSCDHRLSNVTTENLRPCTKNWTVISWHYFSSKP